MKNTSLPIQHRQRFPRLIALAIAAALPIHQEYGEDKLPESKSNASAKVDIDQRDDVLRFMDRIYDPAKATLHCNATNPAEFAA